MVTFSFEKDIARFHSAWSEWKYSVYHKDTPRHYNLAVQGFYGSGKTEFLRQFCEQNKDVVYLNFKDLDSSTALAIFCKQILNGESAPDWVEAVENYKKLTGARFQVLFIDDDNNSAAYKNFESAIQSVKLHNHTLVLHVKSFAPESEQKPGNIKPRSIVDFLLAFPDYDKADIVRLHSLTGGLPAFAKELNADIPFEENLKILLNHDSAFSNFAPSILQRLFRSPESYHPILYSIACGKGVNYIHFNNASPGKTKCFLFTQTEYDEFLKRYPNMADCFIQYSNVYALKERVNCPNNKEIMEIYDACCKSYDHNAAFLDCIDEKVVVEFIDILHYLLPDNCFSPIEIDSDYVDRLFSYTGLMGYRGLTGLLFAIFDDEIYQPLLEIIVKKAIKLGYISQEEKNDYMSIEGINLIVLMVKEDAVDEFGCMV